MSQSYHQGQIIKILNQYLEYHNLPTVFRLDTGGVCSGLSSLYAKYVLENKEAEFIDLLKYMSQKKQDDQWDENVNRFVIEVLKFASPELFTDSIGQAKAYQQIIIDGKNILPAFTLGFVTPKENWVKILSSLNLTQGEAMLVSSANHAICISKNAKEEYVVYDPNYSTRTKTFSSTKEVINELSNNVFAYQNTNIGLAIKILRPTNSLPKIYPETHAIYRKYINKHFSENGATSLGRTAYSLEFAAKVGDENALCELINLNQKKGLKNAIDKVILENEWESLDALLPHATKKDIHHALFLCAEMGKKDSFDCILEYLKLPLQIIIEDSDPKFSTFLMHKSAKSSDPSLLKDMLKCLENLPPPVLEIDLEFKTMDNLERSEDILINRIFKRDKNNKDTIMHAIYSQSAACLTLLLDKLDDKNKSLEPEQQLEYLSLAIQQNNPVMVETLLTHGNNRIRKPLLESLELPFEILKQSDIYLLQTLQKHGMRFSEKEQAIIDQKAHCRIGTILSIKIVLMQFMRWLRDVWEKQFSSVMVEKHFVFNRCLEKNTTTETEKQTKSNHAPSKG